MLKCRRCTFCGHLKSQLGEVFHRLAGQKESWIEESHQRWSQNYWPLLAAHKTKAPGEAGGLLLGQYRTLH